jgi:aspartyl-tRNA(Asn)/glutamyl-tRNA(Gln) amidotransferase subunit C
MPIRMWKPTPQASDAFWFRRLLGIEGHDCHLPKYAWKDAPSEYIQAYFGFWNRGGWGKGWAIASAVVSDRITSEAVAKVAKLARLSLSDDELQQATHQLSDMLDHFADIDALDLESVEPMTHPMDIANVMRDDVVLDVLDREEVLDAAPVAEDGRFRVPPILGLDD